jgi:hypothetical protein
MIPGLPEVEEIYPNEGGYLAKGDNITNTTVPRHQDQEV